MLACGIDVGARTCEVVVLEVGSGAVVASALADTGHDPARTATRLFEQCLAEVGVGRQDVARTVATGYGRNSLPFADEAVTEITCHARGVHEAFPDVRTIVDIGGQDSKVIVLDGQGAVVDFAMNDRCAAGTGRFLEIVSRILDLDLDQLGEVAATARRAAEITSMCAVFAESEVIGLLARGTPREEVVAGVHASIAQRIASLASRLSIGPPAVFTGGVARNQGMVEAVGKALGFDLAVPPQPQMTGALGAALLARERLESK